MHIAVVASSAPSHMYPHLAVVRDLVDRGHRVTYLVGGHFADLARPTGADIAGFDSLLPGSPHAGHWPDDDAAGMRMFLDDSIMYSPRFGLPWTPTGQTSSSTTSAGSPDLWLTCSTRSSKARAARPI